MKCTLRDAKPLRPKGIGLIYECHDIDYYFSDLNDLYIIVRRIASELSRKLGLKIIHLEFDNNEPIGDSYIIYKFHLWIEGIPTYCCSCRIVTYMNKVVFALCTIDSSVLNLLLHKRIIIHMEKPQIEKTMTHEKTIKLSAKKLPPGQKIIPNFIIYRILGQPKVNVDDWRLRINGLVENPLEFTYKELLSMPMKSFISDFHCVTGWTIKNVKWEGIPLKYLAMKAKVLKKARWVHVHSLDEYTTIIPVNDVLDENSLLVIKMNGKILTIEQGFPARIFIPHLYGWKGAKWVKTLMFIDHYVDGYWELLGYHKRGNVWLEERFKKS